MWPCFTEYCNSINYKLKELPLIFLARIQHSFHFRRSLIWNNLPRDINPFSTNFIVMQKPCKLAFTRIMFEKQLWKRENVTLPQVFFKHFASKIQVLDFSVSGTFAKNGLNPDNQYLNLKPKLRTLEILISDVYSYFKFIL